MGKWRLKLSCGDNVRNLDVNGAADLATGGVCPKCHADVTVVHVVAGKMPVHEAWHRLQAAQKRMPDAEAHALMDRVFGEGGW